MAGSVKCDKLGCFHRIAAARSFVLHSVSELNLLFPDCQIEHWGRGMGRLCGLLDVVPGGRRAAKLENTWPEHVHTGLGMGRDALCACWVPGPVRLYQPHLRVCLDYRFRWVLQ